MTRNRSLRLFSLVLVAGAAWMFAPAPAEAHGRHGHDRYEHRDRHHGHYDRHHRYDRHERRHDRWERRRDRWERRHDRWERRNHARYRYYDRRPLFRCDDHRVSFRHRAAYHRHLNHVHRVPYWRLPRLAFHIDF